MVVAAVLALGLAIAGLALPVPFVSLSPGPVTDTLAGSGTASLIQISGHRTYPTTGKLELTTVEEHPSLNLVTALHDWFASDNAVIPRELLQPPGTSQKQVQQQNTQDMITSQDAATAAAFNQLGIKPSSTSVSVAGFSAEAPAAATLAVGDRILAVDGSVVNTAEQLTTAIGRVKPGQPVSITYQRGSAARRTVSITTTGAPGQPGRPIIGITPSEKAVYPVTVKIGLKDVGGPSAGLMFAIGIVDKLTPGDLAGGRTIAGTGEIAQNGAVSPIGGIQQKLLGARRSGATVFLVPAQNCAEASQATPKGLRLVKVSTLTDALGALTSLRANPAARLLSC